MHANYKSLGYQNS